MIKFERITTDQTELYDFMEKLMIDSFPPEEYRDLQELRTYADSRPAFHCNVVYEDDRAIGLMNYWDFISFYYIEHFAISAAQRNGGIGQRTLNQLCEHLGKPIVLEVELPNEEIAQRRIHFYERQGFKLWSNHYLQPPYKPGDEYLPLLIMAYGDLDPSQFEMIQTTIHREVYKVK